MSRRRPRPRFMGVLLATALLLTTGLAACGSDDSDQAGDDGQSDAGYPRTLKTLHGKVTIKKKPEKIVALNETVADELDSLGIEPVAIGTDAKTLKTQRSWMNQKLADKANGAIYAKSEVQPEAVAKFKPDLIIGAPYQLQDKSVVDQLNQIAPTVVPNTVNSNPSWDVRLKYTAQAVNESDKADTITADIKKKYADLGKQVPDIKKKTYNSVNFGNGSFGIGNGSPLGLLGMKPSKLQKEGNGSGKLGKTKSVSQEKMADIDADLLAMWPVTSDDKKTLESDPQYKKLSAVKNGTVYLQTPRTTTALQQASPSSLEWMLPKLTPLVKKLA